MGTAILPSLLRSMDLPSSSRGPHWVRLPPKTSTTIKGQLGHHQFQREQISNAQHRVVPSFAGLPTATQPLPRGPRRNPPVSFDGLNMHVFNTVVPANPSSLRALCDVRHEDEARTKFLAECDKQEARLQAELGITEARRQATLTSHQNGETGVSAFKYRDLATPPPPPTSSILEPCAASLPAQHVYAPTGTYNGEGREATPTASGSTVHPVFELMRGPVLGAGLVPPGARTVAPGSTGSRAGSTFGKALEERAAARYVDGAPFSPAAERFMESEVLEFERHLAAKQEWIDEQCKPQDRAPWYAFKPMYDGEHHLPDLSGRDPFSSKQKMQHTTNDHAPGFTKVRHMGGNPSSLTTFIDPHRR